MGVPPTIRGQSIDAVRVASEGEQRHLTAGGASSFFRRKASDWIAANPAAELHLLARKTWYTLSNVFRTSTTATRSTHATLGHRSDSSSFGPTLLLAFVLWG